MSRMHLRKKFKYENKLLLLISLNNLSATLLIYGLSGLFFHD